MGLALQWGSVWVVAVTMCFRVGWLGPSGKYGSSAGFDFEKRIKFQLAIISACRSPCVFNTRVYAHLTL